MLTYLSANKKVIAIILVLSLCLGMFFGFLSNVDASNKPETVPHGCYLPYCIRWVQGHEDWGCYALGAAGCDVFIENPALRAACLAAVYEGCWVDRYCAEWGRHWYDICPKGVNPPSSVSFELHP